MLNFRQIPVRRQKLLLLMVDAALLLVSLPVAVLLRGTGQPMDLPPFSMLNLPSILLQYFSYYTGATTITTSVFLLVFYIFDLYNVETRRTALRGLFHVLLGSAVALLCISMLYYLGPHWRVGRGLLAIQAGFVAGGMFLWRIVFWRVHSLIARPRRVLIVGAGRVARVLLDELHANFTSEFEVVGLIDDDGGSLRPELNGYRVIGGGADAGRIAREKGVEILVFAVPKQQGAIDPQLMRDILGLKTSGVEVYQMPTFFKKISGRVPVDCIEDPWLIFNQGFVASRNGITERARRALDVIIASGCLVLLSPVILLIVMAVKLTSRGPIFYSQERLGLSRRPYKMIKFRSMVVDAEGKGPVWSSGRRDSRVTFVGRILRRTRMDEIPNFLNVLRGDMSVVGPRPERAHFVERLEKDIPYYDLRFAVKPGLTGWAQVNYSYGSSIEDAWKKLQYELFYIQERSLFLDLVILLKTAQTVLLRPGS